MGDSIGGDDPSPDTSPDISADTAPDATPATSGAPDTPDMLEASNPLATTAQRRAIMRAGLGMPAVGRSRLATQGYVALGAALILTVIIASLAGSSWLSFNPINGIASFGGVALRPQGFGNSSTLPTTAPATPAGTVAALSGQTYPPTVPPTATSRSGAGGVGVGSYPTSFTGTWSGGSGQGCPGGGAPAPRTNVIRGASDYGVGPTNMVALTFDDGPTPFSSPPIISFLEKSHTPATFFVLGQYAHAYPYLVQREAADGFAIGVHTWDHPDMQLLTVSQRANELGSTIQQLHTDLGANFCLWLWRPPYGAVDSSIVRQADAFGLTTINWNVDPADWSRPGTMVIVQRVLSQVRPGSIILMHDGPAAREETAAALPYILAGLHSRGLVPVTLPTLLLSGGYAGGPTATATPKPTATSVAAATPTATPVAPTPTDTPAAPMPTATPTALLSGAFAWLGGAALPALSVWRWWVARPPT